MPLAAGVLAVAFGWAGLMKVIRAERWRRDLVTYRLIRPIRGAGFLLLPWLELGTAVTLVFGAARAGAAMSLGLVVLFCVSIVRARLVVGTNKLGCGCFGTAAVHDYRLLLLRNAILGGLAAVILASGRDLALSDSLVGAVPLVWLLGTLGTLGTLWILRQLKDRLRRPMKAM